MFRNVKELGAALVEDDGLSVCRGVVCWSPEGFADQGVLERIQIG
jgi:hypothetical protein